MSDAKLEQTNVKLETKQSRWNFTASERGFAFEGFLERYLEGHDEDEEARRDVANGESQWKTTE
jgi:DNA topoisomerase IA